ncbi:transglutaminase superfamily protein [Paenibacillus cellulosilyticus]|uniref:Transglutaminase superfamily protein n=1 Tax=Paenibacillus cellulosilyticus TaxID=375489 RepID=A0A2V2YND0_9BACL|nr:transglutaminase domain-containing protein [Paenibacillus cellulosilyticus]PWV97330.1 transglutaminase superfamily protein [Paenibacillus cellulosilyticus]QKS47470.1 transglutaminase [Paenibacillus cellulosilyticus]
MRVTRIVLLAVIAGVLGGSQLFNYWKQKVRPIAVGAVAGTEAFAASAEVKNEQSLAEYIKKQLQTHTDRVSVAMLGSDHSEAALKKALAAATGTDDYIAYIIDSYYYTIRETSIRTDIDLRIRYRETAEQTAEVNRITDRALRNIINDQMNDHEKVKAIHDWVVARVDYDQALQKYTAYEALTTGRAVCQGYALLMYNMLTKAGIENVIAAGTVNTGEHAWNIVKLDGQWYHLDATWDDAAIASTTGVDAAQGAILRSQYRYYLLTDSQMRADHQWTKTYPKATTVYADALRKRMQTVPLEAQRLSKLEAAIGLDWLQSDRTVTSVTALANKLSEMSAGGKRELQVRYTRGDSWNEDIRAAVRQAGIRDGYQVRSTPYGTDGSVLLEVKFTA